MKTRIGRILRSSTGTGLSLRGNILRSSIATRKKIASMALAAILLTSFAAYVFPVPIFNFGSAFAQSSEQYDFEFSWGSNGTGDGQFNHPNNLAIDSAGNIYVADMHNNRVQKFSGDGNFLTKWGTLGTADGQFDWPVGVAIDSAGNVYVTDLNNNRIQKFTSNGTFLAKWGSLGSGDGQFNGPHGIAIHNVSGSVYVADSSGNHRVQKFNTDGIFLSKWGSQGTGDGQFNGPTGVALDASGNVYVADRNNHRVQKFTSDGVFLAKWGSFGSSDGQFNGPHGIAVDTFGSIYVSELGNHRVQKFTSNGTFLAKWGSFGSGDGQFNQAVGVVVSESGKVYATDHSNHRVQVFAPTTADTTAPDITSISDSPDPFSPNGDGALDTTTISFNSDEDGSFIVDINAGNTTVQSYSGVMVAGSNSVVWDGKDFSLTNIVPDGPYQYYITATDAESNTRSAPAGGDGTITVDTGTPFLSDISDAPDPFSPNGDSIDDTNTITFTSNETGSYTVMILTTDSAAVQNLTGTLAVGTNNAIWDGLNYLGSLTPDGTYEYFILAVDDAGNERPISGPDGTITLSTTSDESDVSPPSVLPNLISWWPGDGHANDVSDGNHGTLQNGATFAAGIMGQGFSLDGTNDFVRAEDSTNLDITNAITIDAWIKPAKGGTTIVDKTGSSDLANYRFVLGGAGNDADTRIGFWNGATFVLTTATVPLNQSSHVAVTVDGYGNQATFYINGTLVQISSIGFGAANNGPLRIGADNLGRYFEGTIDEVHIYNRILSEAEIQSLSNGIGNVLINSGDVFTNSSSVALTLACSDLESGCAEMKISTDGTFDTEIFEAIATSKAVTLPSGDGTKTVKVIFKDGAGNESPEASDTIILDTSAISFDKAVYNVTDIAVVTLVSQLSNSDSSTAETVPVNITSTTDPIGIGVSLIETGPDTGVFVNDIQFTTTGFSNSSTLLVSNGDTILASNGFVTATAAISVGSVGSSTSKIAFTSNRDGNAEIYVMNADGTNQTRLTNNAAIDEFPAWSPDGTKIAFTSNRDGNIEVYLMNADGTGQTRLTNNPADDELPSFSPDGTKIAFVSFRDGNDEIYVMNADGTGQTNLSNNTANDFHRPSWSPDGTKIAFVTDRDGNREIYVMNANGTGQTNLTNDGQHDNSPDWSPDGTKIAFSRGPNLAPDIYIMNANGTGQMQLTTEPVSTQPSWSPDSTKIAFTTDRDGNFEIFIMNADGTNPINLSNNTATDFHPSWSPDLTSSTTATLLIGVSDTSPPWGVDVFVDVNVTGAQAGDYVVVSQGNGATFTYPPFEESFSGQLNVTAFAYNSTFVGGTFDVQATLYDSNDTAIATSNVVPVTVEKRPASLALSLPSSVVNGTIFTASGDLADGLAGQGLSNRTITFTTVPATGLADAVTRGIDVVDPSGIEIVSCPVPQCTHDNPNASVVNLLKLHTGATLFVPPGVTAMAVTLQDMSGTVTVKVTRDDGSFYEATSDPAGSGLATFILSARDSGHPTQFLEKVEILSTSVSGELFATSKIELYDADADPTTLVSAAFDLLPAGSYGVSLTIKPGAYYSSALSPVLVLPEIPVSAHFAGDSLYHPAEADLSFATELGFSLGETGIGGTVAIYANANPSFTVLSCSAADPDSDGDGLCDSWEDSAQGIPYACGVETCFFALPSTKVPGTDIVQTTSKDHKDIFVEIDAMDGQAPLDGALRRVIDAFGAAPIDNPDRVPGITLHIIKDQMNLPFVGALGGDGTLFNAWVDPVAGGNDGNKANDYFGVKSVNYGTTDEERTDPALKNARANAIRYNLWVSSIGDSTTSGLAEDLGNDLIIALGNFGGEVNVNGGNTGTETEQAATFMHEMGHLFNLKHGGPAEIVTKIGGTQVDTATLASGGSRSYPRETTLGGYTLTTMGPGSGTIMLQQVMEFSGSVDGISSLKITEDPAADTKLGTPTIAIDGASTSTKKIFNIHYPFDVPYTNPIESIDYAVDFGTPNTGKYLRASSSSVYDVTTQDFWMAGMFKRTSDSGGLEQIINKKGGANANAGYRVHVNPADAFTARFAGGGPGILIGSVTVSLNVWYAWGFSADRDGNLSLYLYNLDTGTLTTDTVNITGESGSATNTLVFTVARNSASSVSFFPGMMDNLIPPQIGETLTQAQFTEFATTGTISGLTPTSKYDFNGRNANDAIGSNHLTANGFPTFPPNTVNPSIDNTVSQMSLGSLKINFNISPSVNIVGFGTPAYPSVTDIIPEDNSMNCKPNYQSVLSYSRQMDGYLNKEGEHLLDYSRGNYAPLMETSLNEELGLFSRDVLGYPYNVIIYGSPGGLEDKDKFQKAQTFGPEANVIAIDWDVSDVASGEGIRANINNLSITGCNAGGVDDHDTVTFYDYNDWNNIKLNWKENSLGTFDGITRAANKAAVEMTKQVYDEIKKQSTTIQIDSLSSDTINYGESVAISGSSSNAPENAVLSIDWGDGTADVLTGVVDPVTGSWPTSGLVSHTYGSDAIGERRIIASLLDSVGLETASSSGTTVLVLKDRTATSLTLTPAVISQTQQFTLTGTLSNLDHPEQGVAGRTITFTSSDTSMIIASTTTDTSGNYMQTATAGTVGSFEIVAHFELPIDTDEEIVMLPSQSPPQTLVVGEITFSDVLPPINPDSSSVFKAKSVVPVKFQLKDKNGNFITDAVATLAIAKISDHVIGTEEVATSATGGDTGNTFRYDSSTDQYVFNWKTPGDADAVGTYALMIYLNYGTPTQKLLTERTDGITVLLSLK